MENISSDFDLKVAQRGEIYTVSGKSAAALYEKLQSLPPEARTLKVSTLKNGTFTMQKIKAAQPPDHYVNERTAASGA